MTTPRTVNPSAQVTLGLVAWLEQTRVQLPLKGVECSFTVRGGVAEVWLDQLYHQNNPEPLDCVYLFPLPADAAVYRCEIKINDRLIRARVEERQEARRLAAEYKAAGHRTALVEEERENLFTLNLGNIQPGDLVLVRLGFFQPLRSLAGQLAVEIPFCPGVRYIPGRPLLRSNLGPGVVNDTDEVPDASRISPPRIDQLHPDAAYVALEGRLDVGAVDAAAVVSPTHAILVRQEREEILVTLADLDSVPDRDFAVRWPEPVVRESTQRAWSCQRDGHCYALLEIRPPAAAATAEERALDFYFLVDRSGSMAGVKWQKAVLALQSCVATLGENDRAMITLFQSDHQDFAEGPQNLPALRTDPNFKHLVRLGTAGGTELRPALEHVVSLVRKHSQDRPASVVLITDAQVGNDEAVLEAAAQAPSLPVHCFGLDTVLNDALLMALARQQGGTFHSLKPDDDIPQAITALARTIRRPVLLGLKLSEGWETADPALPDVFAGQVQYLSARRATGDAPLMLRGEDATGKPVTLGFAHRASASAAPFLFWCKRRIEHCLARDQAAEAIALSRMANLICPLTAFIAWDERENVTLATREIVQPAYAVRCYEEPRMSYRHSPMPQALFDAAEAFSANDLQFARSSLRKRFYAAPVADTPAPPPADEPLRLKLRSLLAPIRKSLELEPDKIEEAFFLPLAQVSDPAHQELELKRLEVFLRELESVVAEFQRRQQELADLRRQVIEMLTGLRKCFEELAQETMRPGLGGKPAVETSRGLLQQLEARYTRTRQEWMAALKRRDLVAEKLRVLLTTHPSR